ncbi:uncharacterized protein MYCFIDRAFT_211905 [Pseudocercospora fijiensis CIRAD86]|uniref:Pre-mRNA-splicing factor n=1 Tax=Pseudocercospora fijiensis (strain CIRAD86) TaxID=383855 RepID=M3AS11_PSEFD|nr:uncharacterized protein MYCFIDRAFT_211905 [Pseudocercospora fijiensis CIRAD86]EME79908.1 hypothetical protein MYCFIDRAFT_211905 [Pseudocercospora fijiensis CIRAD86]
MSGSKISLSLGASRKPLPPSNGVKRPRAALQDDEDDGVEFGKSEQVSHFDKTAGGAIDSNKKKVDTGPLVITAQANRDWREKANQRKRQKSGLPEGHGNSAELDARMRAVEAKVEASKPKFGLNTYKKEQIEDEENADTAMTDGDENVEEPAEADKSALEDNGEGASKKTDDELAMDALLGKTTKDTTLTIAASSAPMSESDAFSHDFRSAPAMASLDDYARVPVEQFGAALLRGMGWKEGEGIGSQKGKKLPKDSGKIPERRANLLGIGAKEDAAIAQEMGVWGKAAKGKDAKIYNPLLLRDKKTGAKYTEEELEKKKQDDERRKYEMEFDRKEKDRERKRRDDDDYDSRDRRREKDRACSRDRRKRREREKDDRRDRDGGRRNYDSESDEEYHRRKEKERRKRREREEEDYDRSDRSRRHHRDREDGRDRRDRRR